jgi:hypothetical protein
MTKKTEKEKPAPLRIVAVYALVDVPARVYEGKPVAGGLSAMELDGTLLDPAVVEMPVSKSAPSHPWECLAWIQRKVEAKIGEGRR